MNTIDSILAVSPSIHQPGYIDLRLGLAAVDWTTQTEAAYLQKSKKSIQGEAGAPFCLVKVQGICILAS